MSKKKTPLVVSIALLGCAMLLLAGCSFQSEPVAKERPVDSLSLDRLKRDETDAKLAAENKAKQQAAENVPSSQSMTPPMKKQYPQAPAMAIDPAKRYTATLATEKGTITIDLVAGMTPKTVNNFVFLAREGFYDGVVFHRTIPGFMIQGGDPDGTGAGGPGYRFADEPFTGEYTRGTIAMANAGPDTNGSQFFIMHADYALPPNYVIFGKVTQGLEVVDAIATAPTLPGGEGSKPVAPIKILSVTITEE
jgi:cyclophilin family peptidyl-prolyl cis-trans isomerase